MLALLLVGAIGALLTFGLALGFFGLAEALIAGPCGGATAVGLLGTWRVYFIRSGETAAAEKRPAKHSHFFD
jgi:hypothetical protein